MNRPLRGVAEVVRDSYAKPGDTPTITIIRSMRRDELRRTLQFNGYEVKGDPPKDMTLPQILKLFEDGQIEFPSADWRPGEKEASALVTEEPSLEHLGVFALKKLCKERGLMFTKTSKKDELLEKLNGGDFAISG